MSIHNIPLDTSNKYKLVEDMCSSCHHTVTWIKQGDIKICPKCGLKVKISKEIK